LRSDNPMTVIFYPHEDELISSSLDQKLDVLLESASRYKAVVLDAMSKSADLSIDKKAAITPRDLTHVYNWEEIAKLLREIRELPETNSATKLAKAVRLKKLAEIYEVLRGAKMAKLEAVRIALINESNQLGLGGSQVA
jgi:hypothetical protein